ncbi:MAG: NAD-dependent epimerase/dehydratase family protein [Caldilineaceae bacterium]
MWRPRALVEAAQAAGVERLLFFSTISVYGASVCGRLLDEETPPHPSTLYAETKWRAEEAVRQARNRAGEALGVVLRLAAVYGPHMRGNYCTLAQALQKGRFFYVGNGQNRRTLVFDADVAQAALLVAESAAAAGQTYNVSDGQIYTLQQIVETICHVQHSRPPKLHLSPAILRGAAAVCQAGAEMVGLRAPITPALIDKLTEDVAVSSAKLQRELGFAPAVNLQQGWQATLGGAAGP